MESNVLKTCKMALEFLVKDFEFSVEFDTTDWKGKDIDNAIAATIYILNNGYSVYKKIKPEKYYESHHDSLVFFADKIEEITEGKIKVIHTDIESMMARANEEGIDWTKVVYECITYHNVFGEKGSKRQLLFRSDKQYKEYLKANSIK